MGALLPLGSLKGLLPCITHWKWPVQLAGEADSTMQKQQTEVFMDQQDAESDTPETPLTTALESQHPLRGG